MSHPTGRSEFLRIDNRVKQVNHHRDHYYKQSVNRHIAHGRLNLYELTRLDNIFREEYQANKESEECKHE
jgi:hypothetical protein